MTASQLIREAALRTKTIVLQDKVIEYADPHLEKVDDKNCWLCAGETHGNGLPIKKAIKATFTDNSHARAQSSRSICSGCAFCLSARELRNYSILAADKLSHPTQAEWRKLLINPPEPLFVMYLAISGQKHLTFKAPVNLHRDFYTVMLEERPVFVRLNKINKQIEAVENLYVYFTKSEISTGNYNQHRIRKCGLGKWQVLEAQVEKWRGTALFDLCVFVAQKKKGEESDL